MKYFLIIISFLAGMFLTPILTQANCKVTEYRCKTIAKGSDNCKNHTNQYAKYNCINFEYKSCLKKNKC